MRKMLASLALTLFFLAVPAAAKANEPAPPAPKAWNNRYECAGNYADMTITVLNRSTRTAKYSVTFAPGYWGSKIVTVPAGSQGVTGAFRITANGVRTIVVTDTLTGAKAEWPTDKPVDCNGLQDKQLPVQPSRSSGALSAKDNRGASAFGPRPEHSWLLGRFSHPLFWIGAFGLLFVGLAAKLYTVYLERPITD